MVKNEENNGTDKIGSLTPNREGYEYKWLASNHIKDHKALNRFSWFCVRELSYGTDVFYVTDKAGLF